MSDCISLDQFEPFRIIGVIVDAIAREKEMTILYRDADDVASARYIIPSTIRKSTTTDSTIVYAFDTQRQGYRSFDITGIVNATPGRVDVTATFVTPLSELEEEPLAEEVDEVPFPVGSRVRSFKGGPLCTVTKLDKEDGSLVTIEFDEGGYLDHWGTEMFVRV